MNFERGYRPKSFFALCLLTLFLLGMSSVQAQTLKLSTVVPEGADWMVKMREGAKEIKTRTDGRVEIKIYGGGVQGRNARQVQRKMRTGQLHGGAFTAGELSVFQRDAFLYSLPLMFNNVEEVEAVRAVMDETLIARLDEAGYVSFGLAGGGFAYLMSNQPLRNISDFAGTKTWTPEGDEISFAAFKALGIAPVMMPVTDVLTGLQTDLLDSVAVPPVGAIVFQWHTRLKYVTDLPVAYVYASLIIDKKAFSRLSEPDQAVVHEVFGEVYRKFDEGGVGQNTEALDALVGSGLQMVEPDSGQVSAWRRTVVASHAEQASAGAFDEALLQQMQEIIARHRAGGGNE